MTARKDVPVATKAQRAVLSVLSDTEVFLSAQDIHGVLRAAGSPVGLTSVYRAVQQLRDGSTVDERRTPAGESGYRLCRTGAHHHHLSCTGCGAAVEIEAPETETWLDAVARRHGYRIDSHILELSGTCQACLAAPGPVASPR